MPIFDFKCKNCGFEDEYFISFDESEGILDCPECSKITLVKVLSKPPGFRWGKNCSLDGVYDKTKNREVYRSEKHEK